MPHDRLVVFDIETVPESTLHSGKDFPPPAFHQVIAIAFLEAGIRRSGAIESFELGELRAGGDPNYTEKELLQGFFQYLERLQPRLVSYNGRGFDVPVIKYRGMVHGLSVPILSHPDYSYRYNIDSHCDLLEVLSDFGASTRMRLSDVCSAMKIPSKLGIDGSDVARLFRAGEIAKIRDYCETDVLSTYLLYLRTALLRGITTASAFESAVAETRQYLLVNKAARPHLDAFLTDWERRIR